MMNADFLDRYLPKGLPEGNRHIALALSGGPDSMALLCLLSAAAAKNDITVHALHIDHGLRPESAGEAQTLKQRIEALNLPGAVKFTALKRKPADGRDASRIQESAREDRYALMAAYCRKKGISRLFLAHHRDDQAETVLFRLAKGSGLDGLGGMQEFTPYNEKLTLVRPVLHMSKQELVDICTDNDIPYFTDPSNENENFARIRMRKSAAVLEREGLSAKRLGVTAARLSRARAALDFYAGELAESALIDISPVRIVYNYGILQKAPSETRLRVLQKALQLLAPSHYGVRMEKLESLENRMFTETAFKQATLGTCIFSKNRKDATLVISCAAQKQN